MQLSFSVHCALFETWLAQLHSTTIELNYLTSIWLSLNKKNPLRNYAGQISNQNKLEHIYPYVIEYVTELD